MICCIGSHQIAPNSGTNRHQNRHQSYAHFSQSHPSDFRSNGGDFETRTDTRTQRILALSATRNRHHNPAKRPSDIRETDMQPAPPLFRDFYPTYGALKRTVGVPRNSVVRLGWVGSSPVRFWAPISTSHIDSRSSRLQRSSRRNGVARTGAPYEPSGLLEPPLPRVLIKVFSESYLHSRSPRRTRLVLCECIGDLFSIEDQGRSPARACVPPITVRSLRIGLGFL
jgi:hypothetical protein